MKNILRGVVFAVSLGLAVPMTLTTISGCAIQSIFQSDPVGASLKTIKDSYEASVHTAGRLYVANLITEAELRNLRTQANKFYAQYVLVVEAHERTKLSSDSPMLKNLQFAIDVFVGAVSNFELRKVS